MMVYQVKIENFRLLQIFRNNGGSPRSRGHAILQTMCTGLCSWFPFTDYWNGNEPSNQGGREAHPYTVFHGNVRPPITVY
jgi:hypothetical protein